MVKQAIAVARLESFCYTSSFEEAACRRMIEHLVIVMYCLYLGFWSSLRVFDLCSPTKLSHDEQDNDWSWSAYLHEYWVYLGMIRIKMANVLPISFSGLAKSYQSRLRSWIEAVMLSFVGCISDFAVLTQIASARSTCHRSSKLTHVQAYSRKHVAWPLPINPGRWNMTKLAHSRSINSSAPTLQGREALEDRSAHQ